MIFLEFISDVRDLGTVKVTVVVVDVNDNPPKFDASQKALVGVPSTSKANYLVTTLKVSEKYRTILTSFLFIIDYSVLNFSEFDIAYCLIRVVWLKLYVEYAFQQKTLGPVVQSVVSLMSSLVVKMLTVLVSTISNSHVFLLKKNVSSFCKCKRYSHFFSKNITT